MTKYENEALIRAQSLSNAELLDEVLERANPDDYDGCWTTRGWNLYLVYKRVLKKRLQNWLKD